MGSRERGKNWEGKWGKIYKKKEMYKMKGNMKNRERQINNRFCRELKVNC